jgi:hypothetical protein
MQPDQMRIPIDAGMAIARETRSAGESALRERDFRRYGLGVSVVLIGLAILAIRGLIRRIETNGQGTLL